ncbi:lysosomal acid phosphatase [Nilaparvata lugens]|uniref:lysosomal acid phosphatase n=1 Tax=Nilaparvata lugens TaxID=108931 RepID=UPI00193CE929|nr:lysosomal acid phosphatase [Nilaparvata lugens]
MLSARNNSHSQSLLLRQSHPKNFGIFFLVVICGFGIGVILFAYTSFADSLYEPETLKYVVVYHRHGARSPTKTYKKDPYSDWRKYWPMGWGQLTLEGKEQMYDMGIRLWKRYSRFVDKFTVQTVRVESSDADRCLMSAQLVLAGLFPPTAADQIWKKDFHWQPIPVHSTPKVYDRKIIMKAPCPRYTAEFNKVLQQSINNATDEDKLLFALLTKDTGMDVKSIRQVESIYSILHIQDGVGLPLPSWTKSIYPDALKERTKDSMSLSTYNTLMKRLHVGPWIKELFERLHNATVKAADSSKANSTMKMTIYSGHDMGLIAVWRAFDFPGKILPNFGATFLFELHHINNENIVKILYYNKTSQAEPHELQIPHCGHPCLLTDLHKNMEYLMPVDWEQECSL